MRNLNSITEKNIWHGIFQLTSIVTPLLQSCCISLLPSFLPDVCLREPLLIGTCTGTCTGWGWDCSCCLSWLPRSLCWFWVPGRSGTVRWDRSTRGKFCLFDNSVQSFEKQGNFSFSCFLSSILIPSLCASLLVGLVIDTNFINTSCLNNLQC